jgi:hypothetical protein
VLFRRRLRSCFWNGFDFALQGTIFVIDYNLLDLDYYRLRCLQMYLRKLHTGASNKREATFRSILIALKQVFFVHI